MKRHPYAPYMMLGYLASVLLAVGCTGTRGPSSSAPAAPSSPPAAELMLPAPSNPDQRIYLGIDASEEFSLNDIRAEVVLIEVFDMYCRHCQREAPNVNRLFSRITADPALAEQVKMIGIGVSNTTFEVDRFRKIYGIKFPLFPDRNRQLARQLAVRQTPTFVAFASGNDGRLHRILHAPGPLGNVEDFLNRLLEQADAAKDISQRQSPPVKYSLPAGRKGMSAGNS